MDLSSAPMGNSPQSALSLSATPIALEPVAVVGIALKFPGDADTPEAFWKLLLDGRCTVTDVPPDRWNVNTFYHPDPDRHDSSHQDIMTLKQSLTVATGYR
ncbi:putative polyketide synthase [Aspergillus ibericus CBS 121593]|uniref:Ketoacyl-synt-domain-containing protein n=1 Tax=Aspergillus ibericus CBS 121593 TaxID=1448316 RepID=A0A395HCI5_9EURO|nr:ketoacyl-synt-domain-containing protein [Aspergillus ibericus CBS 121593]RAL04668.1 ketoacyl-synt-domain-containing protein [Aspergillus ibericus CBS 121593]